MPAILPDDRKRFAPVTLARKKPVAQFVIDRALALTPFLQPRRDFLFRFRRRQAIDERRIDGDAFADESNRSASLPGG